GAVVTNLHIGWLAGEDRGVARSGGGIVGANRSRTGPLLVGYLHRPRVPVEGQDHILTARVSKSKKVSGVRDPGIAMEKERLDGIGGGRGSTISDPELIGGTRGGGNQILVAARGINRAGSLVVPAPAS